MRGRSYHDILLGILIALSYTLTVGEFRGTTALLEHFKTFSLILAGWFAPDIISRVRSEGVSR